MNLHEISGLVVGGAFTAFTGQPVPAPGIGLLSESGAANSNFPPNNFSNATSLFLDSEDNLLAGSNTGEFWRFSVSDPPFLPDPTPRTTTSFYHPSLANGKISAIEQEEFDRYYIIGEFTEVDGQSRPYFARLHGSLGSEPPDAPSISNIIVTDDRALVEITIDQGTLAYQIEYRSHEGAHWFSQPETANSRTYLTGLLPAQTYEVRARTRNVNGWSDWGAMTPFQSEAKLGNSGLTLPSFVPSHPVQAFDHNFQLDADGNLLLRGAFQEGEETKIGIVSISPKFEVSLFVQSAVFPYFIDDFRSDPLGGIIARNGSSSFFRVDENGEVDPSFDAELIPQTSGRDFTVQSDGKVILVDPREDNIGATFIPLARLNADGSRDSSFDPVFTNGANTGTVEKIILLPDDSIFAFGTFDAVDGIPAGEMVKLTPEGEVDSSFQLAPETSSFWIFNDASVDSTGRLLLAGTFQDASEGGRVNLTRLTTSGDIDPTFPELVFSRFSGDIIELQTDGKILASASTDIEFEVNGIPVSGIFRLTPDGELDPNFNQGLGFRRDSSFSTSIRSIKSLPDGTIAVAGLFDRCNGQACDGFALLRGDGTPSDYELWLQAYGLPPESDPTANPDGDSFNLAFEFAYNLSPLLNDSTNSLQATGTRARISPPLQRGVSVSAFFSPDLQTWQEIAPGSDWTLEAPSEFKGLAGYFHFSIDSTN